VGSHVLDIGIKDIDDVVAAARLEDTGVERMFGVDTTDEFAQRTVLSHVTDIRVHGHGVVSQRRGEVVEPAARPGQQVDRPSLRPEFPSGAPRKSLARPTMSKFLAACAVIAASPGRRRA